MNILTQERTPMSDTGRKLFAVGLRMAGDSLRRKTDWQQQLEATRAAIVRLTAEYQALEAGLRLDYHAMPAAAKARCESLVDRMLDDLDPRADEPVINEAVAETLGWAAGLTNQAHQEDVIREALSRYKALRAEPSLPVLGATVDAKLLRKCFCGGMVYQEPTGKIACDNCGRELSEVRR